MVESFFTSTSNVAGAVAARVTSACFTDATGATTRSGPGSRRGDTCCPSGTRPRSGGGLACSPARPLGAPPGRRGPATSALTLQPRYVSHTAQKAADPSAGVPHVLQTRSSVTCRPVGPALHRG